MGKKALLFIIIGVVLGVALAGVGIFFLLQNGGTEPVDEEEKEPVEEVFDTTQGKKLIMEKVQIPLATSAGSKAHFVQADFSITYKTEEALTKANELIPDIKAAIYSVFETKTADQLKVKTIIDPVTGESIVPEDQVAPRVAMCEPVLQAIKNIYLLEEDKENVVSVVISSFIVS